MTTLIDDLITSVAREISARPEQVEAVIEVLETDPDAIGANGECQGLDSEQIRWIRNRLSSARDQRKLHRGHVDRHEQERDAADLQPSAGGWRIKQQRMPAESGRDNYRLRRSPGSRKQRLSASSQAPHYHRPEGQVGHAVKRGLAFRDRKRLPNSSRRSTPLHSVRFRRLFVLIVGVALGAVAMQAILFNDIIFQLHGDHKAIHVPVGLPVEPSRPKQVVGVRSDGTSLVDQPILKATAVALSDKEELEHAANMLERLVAESRQVDPQERQRETR